MKKFLLGFVIGLVFVGLAIVVLVFAALRFGGGRRPSIEANSTLVMQLEGEVPEQSPVDVSIPFLSQPQALSVVGNLAVAAQRRRRFPYQGHRPRAARVEIGWAKLEELRGDILNFKKSGKPVYAYLRGASTQAITTWPPPPTVYLCRRRTSLTSKACGLS